MEKEKLCLRCMRKIGNNTTCPYCRDENNVSQGDPYLPLKTVVGNRYLVGKAIRSNSSGMDYNAFDMQLKRPVTLHELFPQGILTRGDGNYCLVNVGKASDFIDAKESFSDLWRKLSSINGFTALVNVSNVFEDLGTVYAVSDFLGEGQTLRDFLLTKEQGYISWDEARIMLMPVVSALGELHTSGIIHGAISPTNLVIDSKGKVKITGFSIPEIRIKNGDLEAELFDGYAAVEQYGMSTGLCKSTDIYGFSAVLYRTLIGSTPLNASERLTNDKLMIPGKFAEQLPAYVINALVNALQILPEERTPSVELLRNELSASPAAAGTAAEAYSTIYSVEGHENYNEEDVVDYVPQVEKAAPQKKESLRKSTIVAFVCSAVFFLGIIIFVIIGLIGSGENRTDENNNTTSDSIIASEVDETDGYTSITVPDFRGELYDEIKNNEAYKSVLIFVTEYVDSGEKRGTVVSQSINPGITVDSIDPKKVTIKISNGYEVPDVLGENLQDAIQLLKDEGFKNIKTEASDIPAEAGSSNVVYGITYEDEKTGDWVEIPSDNRLSADDRIILYYYGEYVENTAGSTTDVGSVDVTEQTVPATDVTTEAESTVSE